MAEHDTEKAGGGAPDIDAAFKRNTNNANVLWEEIKNVTERAVNTAYGTDPRHGLLACAVADEVAFGKLIPWSIADHFGMSAVSFATRTPPEGES